MKRLIKEIICAALVVAGLNAVASSAGDSVLLWMVDTQDRAIDNGVETTVGQLEVNEKHVNTARVRVFQGGSALDGAWLNLYYQENNRWLVGEGMIDLSFEDGQQYTDPVSGSSGTYVGESWADFGGYANSTYSFAIELGFLDDDQNWFSMAFGEVVGYDALKDFYTTDSVEDPPYGPWTSTYTAVTVPEPSGGLLLLVGGALLALRRRKNMKLRG